MKTIAVIAAVLPIALAAGACARHDVTTALAPDPPGDEFAIRDGAWVTDREALREAAAAAARDPLVERAISEYGAARLTPMPDYTLRAIGTTVGGLRVEFTLLPFVSDGDETHGVFLTRGSVGGAVVAQRAELIAGRAPRPDETGFTQVSLPGGVVWIRDEGSLPPGVLGAPEQVNKVKFLSCLIANAPMACDAGAAIASQIAPAVPYARQVGCGIGVAVAALACLSGSSDKGMPTPKDF